jgi:hypothetical protein
MDFVSHARLYIIDFIGNRQIITAKSPGAPSWLNKDAKPAFLAISENSWRSLRLGGYYR